MNLDHENVPSRMKFDDEVGDYFYGVKISNMLRFMGSLWLTDGGVGATIDFIKDKPYDGVMYILVGCAATQH
jgi:hypothetical protein